MPDKLSQIVKFAALPLFCAYSPGRTWVCGVPIVRFVMIVHWISQGYPLAEASSPNDRICPICAEDVSHSQYVCLGEGDGCAQETHHQCGRRRHSPTVTESAMITYCVIIERVIMMCSTMHNKSAERVS